MKVLKITGATVAVLMLGYLLVVLFLPDYVIVGIHVPKLSGH